MEDGNKNDNRCGVGRWHSWPTRSIAIWWILCTLMLLLSCAPGMYSVNMKYMPAGHFPEVGSSSPPVRVTVANFEDLRNLEDPMLLGWVTPVRGQRVPVLPKFVTPSRAVTEPFKDFLKQAGYLVTTEGPTWNLEESSINKIWGPILVGGSIDELEVTCKRSLTVQKYNAKVKVTVLFADTRTGRIFHRITTESGASLEHIVFSEEKIEDQLNIALSASIEKIFEDGAIIEMINSQARRRP